VRRLYAIPRSAANTNVASALRVETHSFFGGPGKTVTGPCLFSKAPTSCLEQLLTASAYRADRHSHLRDRARRPDQPHRAPCSVRARLQSCVLDLVSLSLHTSHTQVPGQQLQPALRDGTLDCVHSRSDISLLTSRFLLFPSRRCACRRATEESSTTNRLSSACLTTSLSPFRDAQSCTVVTAFMNGPTADRNRR
jgi:hypothetical protein